MLTGSGQRTWTTTTLSLCVVALAFCFSDCSGQTQSAEAVLVQPGHRPPPKAGSSITHTKLCSCRMCWPQHCCGGAKDAAETSSNCDGPDFSTCEMKISSCAGACIQERWRVALNEDCDELRRQECCAVD